MTDQSTQIAVRPQREIRVVSDPIPVWDTAAFEHLGRVASVLTDANLLPQTLTHYGNANNLQPFERQVVLARALLVANQARIWNMDPLAVAQATSIVHNRLMYEGKLVHAVIEAKLGIRLRYEFGLWDTDHFVAVDDEAALSGAGERLSVRVHGQFDDEVEERTVEGSVGAWKTSGAGSPWSPATYRRQLRYRGAREWSRAHSPGVILGVLTDDEVEDFGARQVEVVRASGVMDRLSPPIEGATGFDHDKVVEQTDDTPKGRAKRARKVGSPQEAQEALQAGQAVDVPDSYEKDVTDAVATLSGDLDGDDIPESLRRIAGGGPVTVTKGNDGVSDHIDIRPTETANAPSAELEPASSASATDASGASQEDSPGSEDTERSTSDGPESPAASDDEPEADVVAEGYPEPGEVYHLTGDLWNEEDGRRDTYKDGVPFSSAKRETGHTIYEDHAPEGPGIVITQPEPEPVDEEEPSFPPEFETYMDAVEAAKTWVEVRDAVSTLQKTEFWKGIPPERQNKIRAKTWDFVRDLPETVDQAVNPSAFRLWIEATDDTDAIEGTLAVLRRGAMFEAMSPQQQNTLELIVRQRLIDIKG